MGVSQVLKFRARFGGRIWRYEASSQNGGQYIAIFLYFKTTVISTFYTVQYFASMKTLFCATIFNLHWPKHKKKIRTPPRCVIIVKRGVTSHTAVRSLVWHFTHYASVTLHTGWPPVDSHTQCKEHNTIKNKCNAIWAKGLTVACISKTIKESSLQDYLEKSLQVSIFWEEVSITTLKCASISFHSYSRRGIMITEDGL